MKRFNSKTSDLFIQIISVTIGVFLGFIISNWSESRRESRKFDSLKTTLEAELANNKAKIDQVLTYHRMVRDSSRHYMAQADSVPFKPSFFKGVNTITFVNSAYQTGIQTGLFNSMPLEQIQAINEVYTKQRDYEDFANLMISGLISMDFDNSEASMRPIALFLSISMTDIVIKEEQLLKSIQTAEEKLKY